MIKAFSEKILLKGTVLFSALWLTVACGNQKEDNNLAWAIPITTPADEPLILDCDPNPYLRNNSEINSFLDFYPVNCNQPSNFSSITPSAITGEGSTSVSMAGSQITATVGTGIGYLKLSFSPALATGTHNKSISLTVTGNDSTNAQLYSGAHSSIGFEIFGDPAQDPFYTREIYQPSSRLVTDTGDNQYLNPRLVIPILYGPDIQEIRIYGSGAGQKIIIDNFGLADL